MLLSVYFLLVFLSNKVFVLIRITSSNNTSRTDCIWLTMPLLQSAAGAAVEFCRWLSTTMIPSQVLKDASCFPASSKDFLGDAGTNAPWFLSKRAPTCEQGIKSAAKTAVDAAGLLQKWWRRGCVAILHAVPARLQLRLDWPKSAARSSVPLGLEGLVRFCMHVPRRMGAT